MNNENVNVHTLDSRLLQLVLSSTGASKIVRSEAVQSLWSGFGQIVRLELEWPDHNPNEQTRTVIVKHVQPPAQNRHPRGWNSDASTQRKLRSYQVEANWYSKYAESCNKLCTVPIQYASQTSDEQTWLILEDLDLRFPRRHSQLSVDTCQPCLKWLARFHAHHYQHVGEGLWPTGTYWHLQTRHDEYEAMAEGALKQAATKLDVALATCPSQTLVHGDAKVANFCFSETGDAVAMVDFQYIGRGCGIRDVVYFLGSCLSDSDCQHHAGTLVDIYFSELRQYMPAKVSSAVEQQWRALYPIAWADFNRFLAGWMPGHRKINSYMNTMTEQALAQL